MTFFSVVLFLMFVESVVLQGLGSGKNGNLRLCVVEGGGTYQRARKYCPQLDEANCGVECVLGEDNLDCIQRMIKGKVDLAVATGEDLMAAQWVQADLLVTHQLMTRNRPFERSIVAVVNKAILPTHRSSVGLILSNRTLCHPGTPRWDIRELSDILLAYLETLVTVKSCDPELTMAENRIKALANFFGQACKAGPWVPDKERDAELKRKYPSMCAACVFNTCKEDDVYIGTNGALTCLSDVSGDMAWADLDDVIAFYKLSDPNRSEAHVKLANQLAYLCRDGSWQPLDNPAPCTWLNRPWPVVVAKRKATTAVQSLVTSLNATSLTDQGWRGALSSLMEIHRPPLELDSPSTALDYLSSAPGFREAYSQSGCDPPRHITICAQSRLARNKCEWLSEAASVYGITPPLQCAERSTIGECMSAIEKGDCDVTVADSDWLVAAARNYSLTPILHESTPIVEKANTVFAYVKSDRSFNSMVDLRGKRAAFPRFDGLAWHSVFGYLKKTLKEPCGGMISSYFSEICAPGAENFEFSDGVKNKLTANCFKNGDEILGGDSQALRLVAEGKSDVAFVSRRGFNLAYQSKEPWTKELANMKPLCPENNKKYCFISWSHVGHIFAKKNLTSIRRHELINVFTSMDKVFGRQPRLNRVRMFSMYGKYNHTLDVLFHNNTKILTTDVSSKSYPYTTYPNNFERSFLNATDRCTLTDVNNYAAKMYSTTVLVLASLVVYFFSLI